MPTIKVYQLTPVGRGKDFLKPIEVSQLKPAFVIGRNEDTFSKTSAKYASFVSRNHVRLFLKEGSPQLFMVPLCNPPSHLAVNGVPCENSDEQAMNQGDTMCLLAPQKMFNYELVHKTVHKYPVRKPPAKQLAIASPQESGSASRSRAGAATSSRGAVRSAAAMVGRSGAADALSSSSSGSHRRAGNNIISTHDAVLAQFNELLDLAEEEAKVSRHAVVRDKFLTAFVFYRSRVERLWRARRPVSRLLLLCDRVDDAINILSTMATLTSVCGNDGGSVHVVPARGGSSGQHQDQDLHCALFETATSLKLQLVPTICTIISKFKDVGLQKAVERLVESTLASLRPVDVQAVLGLIDALLRSARRDKCAYCQETVANVTTLLFNALLENHRAVQDRLAAEMRRQKQQQRGGHESAAVSVAAVGGRAMGPRRHYISDPGWDSDDSNDEQEKRSREGCKEAKERCSATVEASIGTVGPIIKEEKSRIEEHSGSLVLAQMDFSVLIQFLVVLQNCGRYFGCASAEAYWRSLLAVMGEAVSLTTLADAFEELQKRSQDEVPDLMQSLSLGASSSRSSPKSEKCDAVNETAVAEAAAEVVLPHAHVCLFFDLLLMQASAVFRRTARMGRAQIAAEATRTAELLLRNAPYREEDPNSILRCFLAAITGDDNIEGKSMAAATGRDGATVTCPRQSDEVGPILKQLLTSEVVCDNIRAGSTAFSRCCDARVDMLSRQLEQQQLQHHAQSSTTALPVFSWEMTLAHTPHFPEFEDFLHSNEESTVLSGLFVDAEHAKAFVYVYCQGTQQQQGALCSSTAAAYSSGVVRVGETKERGHPTLSLPPPPPHSSSANRGSSSPSSARKLASAPSSPERKGCSSSSGSGSFSAVGVITDNYKKQREPEVPVEGVIDYRSKAVLLRMAAIGGGEPAQCKYSVTAVVSGTGRRTHVHVRKTRQYYTWLTAAHRELAAEKSRILTLLAIGTCNVCADGSRALAIATKVSGGLSQVG